ncbi:MAG: Gldg family protein [Pseudomonadota bacterium]
MTTLIRKNLYTGAGLLLLAVLFIIATMLSSAVFKQWRVDLTENRLFTLSDGTINIVRSLEEPVTFRLYFSEGASEDLPQIRRYANRVEELMLEMAAKSNDLLDVQRIDPAPFSEAEDDAARYGLEGVPISQAGDVLYLGLVGTNTIDGLETLPFLSPQREAFLEYDLARMLHSLSQPDLPSVGVISGLPISGGFNMQTAQQNPPWAVWEQLNELFNVTMIQPSASELPASMDALVLIHPKNLTDTLWQQIDQFVLSGGRLLAFIDPYAEADPGDNPMDPASAIMAVRASSLGPLMQAWGIEMDQERFVADLGRALQVNLTPGEPPVRHPAIIGLTVDDMDREDIITGDLEAINMASPGHIDLSALTEGLDAMVLMESSQLSGMLPTERLRFGGNPPELIDELGIDEVRKPIAIRLSGSARTAFPGSTGVDHQTEGSINAVIVSDTDLLTDRMWVQRQNFLGSVLLNPFADNGALAITAVENLLGNADLISVRSRLTSSRPFELVDDLRREAESNLRSTEQRLELELLETENRLTELQQARGDTDLSILTPEQEAEIDNFVEQRLAIRQQLRQVRRELDQDIEALGTRIKLLNIVTVPLLITAVALLVAWRRRRSQQQRSEA